MPSCASKEHRRFRSQGNARLESRTDQSRCPQGTGAPKASKGAALPCQDFMLYFDGYGVGSVYSDPT